MGFFLCYSQRSEAVVERVRVAKAAVANIVLCRMVVPLIV